MSHEQCAIRNRAPPHSGDGACFSRYGGAISLQAVLLPSSIQAVTRPALSKAWRRDGPTVDTIAWLLDLFAGTICAGYVNAGRISPRIARDYARDKEPLKDGLGHIPIRK